MKQFPVNEWITFLYQNEKCIGRTYFDKFKNAQVLTLLPSANAVILNFEDIENPKLLRLLTDQPIKMDANYKYCLN